MYTNNNNININIPRFRSVLLTSGGVISAFSWGGGEFIFIFQLPPDYWKIGKNSTLYVRVVIWRYS